MGFPISRRRIIAVVTVAVCLYVSLHAEGSEKAPRELFAAGNNAYKAGDYLAAIEDYRQIAEEGYESGPLYYNLAGAYFKSGDLGRAILNYRRAELFMPRDADLKTNYKFALSEVRSPSIPDKGAWNWYPLRVYSDTLTVKEMVYVASGAYLLVLVLLFLIVIRPSSFRPLAVLALLCAIFLVFSSVMAWHKSVSADKAGIVTVTGTEALFGPFETATKFFNLQEGMEVSVIATEGDWYKIRRSDGKVGWVPKTAITRVVK